MPQPSNLSGGAAPSIRNIPGQWRAALGEILRSWRPLVLFQIWYALIVSAILSSAAGWMLEQVVRTSGSAAITNFDLAGFFLSPRGLAFLALLAGTWSAFFWAERSGVLLMAAANPPAAMGATGALRLSLRRSPHWMWLGGWYLLVFAGVLLPIAVIAAVIAKFLLGAHDINYYLYHQPREWWLAVVCGILLGAAYAGAVLALWFRLVFALQLVLFGRETPRAALARSWSMTKGRILSLALALGGWWLVVALLTAAGSALVGCGALAALRATGSHAGTSLAVILMGAAAIWLVGAAGHILSMSGEVILAHRFYLACGGTVPTQIPGPGGTPARRWPLAWTITAVACLALVAGVSLIGWRLEMAGHEEQFTVTAHRAGAAKAPENTLAALRQAIADGADLAEIDVQTTRDGELVILHDGDLARLAGDPRRVEELTLSELRQLDIGRWHDPSFAGERVATLGEMIALAKGRIRLNVELKYNRDDPALAAKVLQLLRSEGVLDQCVITSLEHSAIREVKRLAPDVRAGLIVTKSIGDPADVDADFLSLNQDAVSPRLLYRAHSRGKQVHVWTVNDRPSMERMVEMGVDSLITDHPAQAVELRRARAALSGPEKLVLRLRRAFLGR
ncbi:MAG: glycerophosphodiester phosphodiesterase [Planctomycetaceae bacterium]|nr:glycerophosphodiester phosphodiesterase [Planctomycetaceae bacterium]